MARTKGFSQKKNGWEAHFYVPKEPQNVEENCRRH
jgi:hypothetical protein